MPRFRARKQKQGKYPCNAWKERFLNANQWIAKGLIWDLLGRKGPEGFVRSMPGHYVQPRINCGQALFHHGCRDRQTKFDPGNASRIFTCKCAHNVQDISRLCWAFCFGWCNCQGLDRDRYSSWEPPPKADEKETFWTFLDFSLPFVSFIDVVDVYPCLLQDVEAPNPKIYCKQDVPEKS